MGKYLSNLLELTKENHEELKSELSILSDEDFYLWRMFRLLAHNYTSILRFSRSNMIDYSLKNVILIILKAFSNMPHSKIEALKEKLNDVKNVREQETEAPEIPVIESDQESGEIQINGKEEKRKESPKRPTLNKKYVNDKQKKTYRETEYIEKDSQTKYKSLKNERSERSERGERGERGAKDDRDDKGYRRDRVDYKSHGKSYKTGYKRHKYH